MINEFRRMMEPPISGLDALLVSQMALNMDVEEFIRDTDILASELDDRAGSGVSAYEKKGRRILMAGSPAPMGYAKVHWIAESAGLRIVADESCTGIRYFRDLVDETPETLEDLIKAVADRYMKIDCSCFSPNTERIHNVLQLVEEYKVDGVIHHVLQYCHTYNIEARILERELKKRKIPSLIIETDYSQEDAGQIRTRIEAFAEMLATA
jgi:benzoyl-CoA reductase/2-hydroxyglutaryl-CoA dehydratase subunit BcrC/BadD/HgdB